MPPQQVAGPSPHAEQTRPGPPPDGRAPASPCLCLPGPGGLPASPGPHYAAFLSVRPALSVPTSLGSGRRAMKSGFLAP